MFRRICVVLIFGATTCSIASGQNLVLNPSFECGQDFCGAFQPEQAALLSTYACNWMAPGQGTSDIHSTQLMWACFNSQPYRVDAHEYVGSQMPRTGNRFGGIYTYMALSQADSNYREYLEGRLTEPLEPGDTYCAEFYTSRAEYMHYASNNLGIRFNPGPTFHQGYRVLNQSPQILETNILTDTAKWTRVGGMFTATEPASYLVIGNFTSDRLTSSVRFSPPGYEHSYYFIEDVSVEKLPADVFTFSGDTTICVGDKTTLSADARTSYVIWQEISKPGIVHVGRDLETGPDVTTTYVTTAKGCGKEVKDTITVYVHPKALVNLGADTTICAGAWIKVKAASPFDFYKWQDGSTQTSITVSEAGTYSVTVSNGLGCTAYDEKIIEVRSPPQVDLGPDQLVCSADYPVLRAGPEYDYYVWSSGTVDSVYAPSRSGDYSVTVGNQCGEASDRVTIYSGFDVVLPNVLTLNGDGLNETLRVLPEINYGNGSIRIYNRWGSQIFNNDQYDGQWPGNSTDIAAGTYFYNYKLGVCPAVKGFVEVVR
ncbi:MAG TPA: gliding motility-associated C-terminal domain-containing protein [Cyclobacteriaceae bacterium]|nr:gliding motility-associated C-terminal domain-containing protein [Cyclobacteriaceae bacterium]